MSALLQRVSIAILLIALTISACGPVTPVPATSPEPTVVPTSNPSEEKEVDEYEQGNQKIREEFYGWADRVEAELDYVIATDTYERNEWIDCETYLILGQLVTPPSDAFSVCLKHGYIEKQQEGYTLRGETVIWPDPLGDSARTGKVYWNEDWSNYQWAPYFNAERVDQAHVNYTDIRLYFDGASNWRSYAVMPSIFDSNDGIGLVSCNAHEHGYQLGGDDFYYEYYFVDPIEVIYDTGGGPLTAVMPGLGIIEFEGKSYRIPESCLNEDSLFQLEDRSTWHPGVAVNSSPWSIGEILATSQLADDIDPNSVSATKSEFPKVILEQVFFGDFVGLFAYNGAKYLVDMDDFVNIQYDTQWNAIADDRESLEKAINDGDILLPLELTVLPPAFGYWNCLIAFDPPTLPGKTVAANTTTLNYQHVNITVYHMCHEYDLVIFDEMYMWPVKELEIEFDFDFDYDANPNYISGYWHYEKGWESVHIYDTPRNTQKDEVVVGLIQKIAQLDGKWEGKPTLERAANTGPLEACMDLIWYKQWVYTGESAETIEAACGTAMDFMERYNAESVMSEYDEWEVYASTLLPDVDPSTVTVINSMSTHVPMSRYKYGQYIMYMSVDKETACLLDSGEYGVNLIFESDGWTKSECVPQGAFVFMLDYNFNDQATGKPWDAVKGTQVYQVFP